jgi:hypothetical protein
MLTKPNLTLRRHPKNPLGKLFLSHKKMTSQRGSIVLMTALFIPVLLCLGAIAIEIGHVLVVRNELQNAADAAALNGAGHLYRPGASFNVLTIGPVPKTMRFSWCKQTLQMAKS